MYENKVERINNISDEVDELHPIISSLLGVLPSVISHEYTHGSREMGADFVFEKQDEVLLRTSYVGIVVKIGKISQDTTKIEQQIDECFLIERFYNSGKKKIYISEVWVMTTQNISENAKQKIFEKFKNRKIEFISGHDLIALIDKYVPTFWSNIEVKTGLYLEKLRTENHKENLQSSIIVVGDAPIYIENDVIEYVRIPKRMNPRFFKTNKKIDPIDAIENNRFVLLEGDMGSGKSSLLRKIIDHYCSPEIYLTKKCIPIRCTYAELYVDHNNSLENLVKSSVDADLLSKAADSKIIIFLDAFDELEIESDERKKHIEELIRQSESSNYNLHITLASRDLDDFDSQIFGVYRLQIPPLTLSKTVNFIQEICKTMNLSKKIFDDISRSQVFRMLPQNPISAILLARLINDNSADLPSNLTELYAKYTELSLGRWDINKGIKSEKEYEAVQNILMNIAEFMLDNNVPKLSLTEAREKFRDYLSERNLNLDHDALLNKLIKRSDIIYGSIEDNIFMFKHKTFLEYLYALKKIRTDGMPMSEKIFNLYWMNSYFFYLGLKKDAPLQLTEISDMVPKSEIEKFVKIINFPDILLAAYSTPYQTTHRLLDKVITEFSEFYLRIVSGKTKSFLSSMPQIVLLFMFQSIFRRKYSYDYLKKSLKEISKDLASADDALSMYKLYFCVVALIELGEYAELEYFSKKMKNLPLEVYFAISHEKIDKTKGLEFGKALKKFEKVVNKTTEFKKRINQMIDDPIDKNF